MTVSPDARTPSASVHALSGSTPPGAGATMQPFGVATAAVHELPDTFAPLGALASGVVDNLKARRAAAAHPDAVVIDLAARTQALADRHARVYDRMLVIHGRLDRWSFANCPERLEEVPSQMTLVRSRTDTHEVTHVEQPLAVLAEQKARREAWATAQAAHDDAVERKRARTREPYLDNLQGRMWRRLERWTRTLTDAEPRTQAGLAAKIVASNAVTRAADDLDWAQKLMASLGRDALRIVGAEADARAELDRQADGELLALGRAWDIAHELLDEASLRETDAHDRFADVKPDIPEELFRRDTDHRHVGPYGSVHARTGCRWYGSPDTIRMLREGCPSTLGEERRQEILDAHERWLAGLRDASLACGLEAIADEVEMLGNREFEIRSKIVSTPAHTHKGVQVKARVAFSLGSMWEEAFTRKIAEGVKDETIPAELMALSIVLDLARMSRGTVAAAEPARAASAA